MRASQPMFVIVDALANGRLGLHWSTNCPILPLQPFLMLGFSFTRPSCSISVIAFLTNFYQPDDLECAESTGPHPRQHCDVTYNHGARLFCRP